MHIVLYNFSLLIRKGENDFTVYFNPFALQTDFFLTLQLTMMGNSDLFAWGFMAYQQYFSYFTVTVYKSIFPGLFLASILSPRITAVLNVK